MKDVLYFEDFHIGQTFEAGPHVLTKEASLAFAHEFDPQYFHVDEEAAKKSLFTKLAASGWHTAAISMRLKVDTPLSKVSGGLIGLGVEELRWPRPVYPGDVLRIVITILDTRFSKSRPKDGIVRYKMDTFNQKNELVMEASTAVIVPRRSSTA